MSEKIEKTFEQVREGRNKAIDSLTEHLIDSLCSKKPDGLKAVDLLNNIRALRSLNVSQDADGKIVLV